MKIGIKYCGGCNPGFDRKRFVNLLKNEFVDITFENADKNTCYDLMMVISGCSRACVNKSDLKHRNILYITKEADYEKAKEVILNFITV